MKTFGLGDFADQLSIDQVNGALGNVGTDYRMQMPQPQATDFEVPGNAPIGAAAVQQPQQEEEKKSGGFGGILGMVGQFMGGTYGAALKGAGSLMGGKK